MTNFVMKIIVMKIDVLNFGNFIAAERQKLGLKKSDLSRVTGIDAAILSKIESGERTATRAQVELLSTQFSLPSELLIKRWLSEKIYNLVEDETYGLEALMFAEQQVKYNALKRLKTEDTYPTDWQDKLQKLDALKIELAKKKPANTIQLKKLRDYFSVQYTYESNRIEGNTLTMQETHLVINEGITIGGKSMREHLEVLNHAEAIDFIFDLVTKNTAISERVLKELHYLVLKGIDRENAGRYRSVPVRIGGSAFVPAQPYMVPKLMEEVFEFYENNHYCPIKIKKII
jgi:transcriptional regulator with XRE-family HTH domain